MNRLTIEEIEGWLRGVSTVQPGYEVEVEMRQFSGPKPGVVMDLFSADLTIAGRITAWVSGEFDFEVLRDGSSALYEHFDAASLSELEPPRVRFVAALRKPEDANGM